MDFLRHVNRIRIELLILYFNWSHVEISKLYVSVINFFLSLETVQTLMKYSIMQFLIWVFTICTCLQVSSIKRVTEVNL